jgi:zeaxanthin glucosyltransferase
MTLRYGLITPPAIGHLNPMVALALVLIRRGHAVVVFTVADGAAKLSGLPLELVTIGAEPFPPGAVDAAYAELGRLSGRAGLRFSVDYFLSEQAMLFAELPAALQAASVDVLLVDQLNPAGGAVAERLGLPFVTLCNALPVNREPAVPPYFTGWLPSRRPWARWRNQLGNVLLDRLTAPICARRRRSHHCCSWRSCLPPLISPGNGWHRNFTMWAGWRIPRARSRCCARPCTSLGNDWMGDR